jgi:membrane protein
MASGILPSGAADILREQISRIATNRAAGLSFGFIFGLGVALWSANAGMKAIMDALNVVYEEKENRGFIKLNLVSLAFTMAAIGSLLLALGAVVILPVVLGYLGLQNVIDTLFRLARWPLLLARVIIGLAVLYRFGPSRREPRWQWIRSAVSLPRRRGLSVRRYCPAILQALPTTTPLTALLAPALV